MADQVQVKVQGLAELKEGLVSLGPKLQNRGLRKANYDGAEVLAEAAKRTSAFKDRTGELRSHIAVFRRGYKDGIASHAVGVRGLTKTYADTARNRKRKRVGKKYRVAAGPSLYGRFLEFGTSRMAAHAWLRPALFQNLQNMIEAIRAGMASAIAMYAPKKTS